MSNPVLAQATPAAAVAAKMRASALVRVQSGQRPFWHVLASAPDPRAKALRRIRLDDLLGAALGFTTTERNRFVARLRAYARVDGRAYDKDLTVAWAIRTNARNFHTHLRRIGAIHDAIDARSETRAQRVVGYPWSMPEHLRRSW